MRPETDILLHLERARKTLNGTASRKARSAIGQFFTPAPIACFMASLFEKTCDDVRILDAGAGMGILFAALVRNLCSRVKKPKSIEIVAYESDKKLVPHLEKAVNLCREACLEAGIRYDGIIVCEDFISGAVAELDEGLFGGQGKQFTHVILNPPYKKINGRTYTRKLLSTAGLETSNLYAAFAWLSVRLLLPGGEIVAITPRSFCNGPYFKPFRKALLDLISLRQIHLFESRKEAFADDSVLQENVIFYGIRGERQPTTVKVSVSKGADLDHVSIREISFRRVVLPGDSDAFIHLIDDDEGKQVMDRMARFNTTLENLGLQVSTGRVVDFRARAYLRNNPEPGMAPIIYPCHLENGFVRWPLPNGKKPNAIVSSIQTRGLLIKKGYYVLTKRFSAKEECRRVVAAIYDPKRIDARLVGFENHLNYFHANGEGLSEDLAKGLAVFLNSTLFDRYFRLFSGHSQVNATDLRKMHYPLRAHLEMLGRGIGDHMPDQETIDTILEKEYVTDG